MFTQISLNAIVIDSDYLFTLMATDENNVSKTIKMPIALSSDEGVFVNNLINQAWNYIPDAEPDALSQAKARKLQSINNEWLNLERIGWDTGLPQGHLGITPNDVALISGAFALAKEAANLGLPIPSLVTLENNELSFNTITEMLQLMLLYGQSRSQMSMQIASKRKAVENALTIEEVEAI
jgi:hypothetical protein